MSSGSMMGAAARELENKAGPNTPTYHGMPRHVDPSFYPTCIAFSHCPPLSQAEIAALVMVVSGTTPGGRRGEEEERTW